MNRPGFVIPVYNHGSTIETVVQGILPFGFPIILVDDGNNEENKRLIQECSERHKEISLVSYPENHGKGYAMSQGVEKAAELNLTHIFQLDADAQHDISACQAFLNLSEENPDAIINGYPQYDSSVPYARKNGREFSNIFARIVTLNSSPKDVLCGFRIYPLNPYLRLIKNHAFINQRMGYDVDILVHLLWLGCPLENHPVKVCYPKDGISNFRIFWDNVSISLTFARLCLGMIIRLPKLCLQIRRRRLGRKGEKLER